MDLLQRTRKLTVETVTILAEALYFWFQMKLEKRSEDRKDPEKKRKEREDMAFVKNYPSDSLPFSLYESEKN